MQNPLIYLLIGAAVLSLVIGHPADAAVIAGVVVLNTLLGFFQEWRAEGAPERILEFSSHVLRDGEPVELNDDLRRDIVETIGQYAAQALRVMAGAYRQMPRGQDLLEQAPPRTNSSSCRRSRSKVMLSP